MHINMEMTKNRNKKGEKREKLATYIFRRKSFTTSRKENNALISTRGRKEG